MHQQAAIEVRMQAGASARGLSRPRRRYVLAAINTSSVLHGRLR
jgi:hypothetical protein